MKTDRSWMIDDGQSETFSDTGWPMYFVAVVLFFLADHWRTVVGTVAIVGTLCLEYFLFNWAFAKLVVCLGTAAAAFISILIVELCLANKNCNAQSTLELWRSKAGLKAHMFLAALSMVVIGLAAYFANNVHGTSVYWPAALWTIVACPLVILLTGYLSTGSRLIPSH